MTAESNAQMPVAEVVERCAENVVGVGVAAVENVADLFVDSPEV